RHEGGIQDFGGNLIHSSTGALYPGLQLQSEIDLLQATYKRVEAERNVWQKKGELSQVTSDVLLESATTYLDLLAARRGEAIARELEKEERSLLKEAERLAGETRRGFTAESEGMRAVVQARAAGIARLRHQGNAASARLVYLLGLPPHTCLVPVDLSLAPVDLVDSNPPCDQLVAQALSTGPGV